MTEDRISRNVRRGISWNLLAAVVTNAARIAVLTILGRALTPADYGVVASAISVNAVIFGMRDVGLGAALIQRKEIGRHHIVTTFSVSLILGLLAMVGLYFAAPLIASAFEMPALKDVMRALSFLFLLTGGALVSRSLVQRELKFRTAAVIDTVAFLCGAAISVVLALLGYGAWSLVIGYIAEELVASISYVAVQRPPLEFGIDRTSFKELIGYGGWQTVAQIAGIVATQADNTIVGATLGARPLGNYGRAYDLVRFPSQVFTAIAGNVLFSSFSRVQDDIARVAQGFRRGLYANALLLLPGSAWLIVCAPEVVTALIGPKWMDVVLPFQILAVTIMFRTSQKLSALLVQSQGRVKIVGLVYIAYVVAVIVATSIAVRWGIAMVAVSTGIAIFSVTVVMTAFAMKLSRTKFTTVLVVHLPGVMCAAAVAGICWPLARYLRIAQYMPWTILGITGASSLVATIVMIRLSKALLPVEYAWLVSQLPGKRASKQTD
jgi:O-antigen/teichoic acid export membrane protein